MENGLVNSRVDVIAKDKDGTLWFGTPFGASSFDGTTWKTYSDKNGLPDKWVTSILVDDENNIWFGTKTRGIAVLERKKVL
jgi:ligand-binding sensor domain-containing protein